MRKQRLFAVTCAVAVVVAVISITAYYLFTNRPVELHGYVYKEPEKAADFTLTDHNGQPFTLSDQDGKIVLLFFGYTHCPDVCPTGMTKFAWIRENLGSDKDRVVFVFVTVDPQRDTLEVLKDYVNRYNSGITGLTDSRDNLESVWASYGIYVNATQTHSHTDESDHFVDHTALVFIIDKNLMPREEFLIDDPKEEILADIQTLLSEE